MANVEHYGDIALGRGSQAAFIITSESPEKATTITKKETGSGVLAKWGDDNRYPQRFMEALKKNGSGGAALRFIRATHFGQGFHLYKTEATEDGKREQKMQAVSDYKEVQEYFKNVKIDRFWTELIADLETFYIAFPEFLLSKDYTKIVSQKRQPAAKIRFEKMDIKTGLVEHVYMCHDWQANTSVDSDYVAKIPVVDSFWSADQIREYCKKNKIHKFIMPIFYPLMDETYYPEADWHAVFKNGWMDVANSIPEYKQKLFQNQLHIKYVVHISEEYFTRTYGEDWRTFEPEQRKKIREDLADAIDEHLAGNDNAGKSIQSVTYRDVNGNWVDGIKVEAIDDKLKDGAYLPEASAANSEIMFALGVDPSLIGAGIPGGKLNTGSGSDKREAFSILTSLFKTKRQTTLDVWHLVRDYNAWPEDLEGGFANTELTTLDKNPTGTKTTI